MGVDRSELPSGHVVQTTFVVWDVTMGSSSKAGRWFPVTWGHLSTGLQGRLFHCHVLQDGHHRT